MPAEFRLPFILADLEDLSYKEIADVMECPAGTVMSRLYRGRRLLQKRLHDYAVESDIRDEGPRPQHGRAKQRRPARPERRWSIWMVFAR